MAVFARHNWAPPPAGTVITALATADFICAGLARELEPGSRDITLVSSGIRRTLVAPQGWWRSLLKDDKIPVSGWLSIIWPLAKTECTSRNMSKTVIERYVIYQTRGRMFHPIFNHPEVVWKTRRSGVCFLTNFEVFGHRMKPVKPLVIFGEIQSKKFTKFYDN